jgi:hypothetical protein
MKFLNRHLLTIGRLFVLLFLLANSGFTVVLYRCTMGEIDCCGTSEDDMSCACSTMDPPHTSSEPSIAAGINCQSVIVAGGLKTDPTVVEKESAARLLKVDLVVAFAPNFASSTITSQFHPFFLPSVRDVSPPTVGTYILNSTFLI